MNIYHNNKWVCYVITTSNRIHCINITRNNQQIVHAYKYKYVNGCAVKVAGPTGHGAPGCPTGDEPQPEERVGRPPGGLSLSAGTLTLLSFHMGGWSFQEEVEPKYNEFNQLNSFFANYYIKTVSSSHITMTSLCWGG